MNLKIRATERLAKMTFRGMSLGKHSAKKVQVEPNLVQRSPKPS
jgi:hypothetical protein